MGHETDDDLDRRIELGQGETTRSWFTIGRLPIFPLSEVTLSTLEWAVRADRSIAKLTLPKRQNLLSGTFTPDGRTLLAGSVGGNLSVWDVPTLSLRRLIATRNDVISQIDVSPDGRLALIAGGERPGIWDISSGKLIWELSESKNGVARTGRFSPDGKLFALGYLKDAAEIREVPTGRLLYELQGPKDFEAAYQRRTVSTFWARADDPVAEATEKTQWRLFGGMSDVIFSPDGKLLATAGGGDSEGAARLFGVATGELDSTLRGKNLTLASYGNQRLTFSPDGSLLFLAGRDHKIAVWDVRTKSLKSTFPRTVDATALTVSHSGDFLAAGYQDGSVWVWQIKEAQPVAALAAHDGPVRSLAFDQDDGLLVSSSDDGSIQLWASDLASCTLRPGSDCDRVTVPLAPIREHGDTVHSVFFAPSGDMLASISRDGSIGLWRTQDRGLVHLAASRLPPSIALPLSLEAGPQSNIHFSDFMRFSDDGSRLLAFAGGAISGFTLWDVKQHKSLCTIQGERISGGKGSRFQLFDTPLDPRNFECGAQARDNSSWFGQLIADQLWRVNADGTRALAKRLWLEHEAEGSPPSSVGKWLP